jgi:hypothetical protein
MESQNKKENKKMKTKIIGKILLSLSLMFVLVSGITQVHGDSPTISLVTVHSTGDVTRGNTGSFVLNMKPPLTFGGMYVNFSVSGAAVPGIDYVSLISPTYVGPSGYGVILVNTLADPRASAGRRSYDVIITLKSGPGYVVGEPKSAKMTINPPCPDCSDN